MAETRRGTQTETVPYKAAQSTQLERTTQDLGAAYGADMGTGKRATRIRTTQGPTDTNDKATKEISRECKCKTQGNLGIIETFNKTTTTPTTTYTDSKPDHTTRPTETYSMAAPATYATTYDTTTPETYNIRVCKCKEQGNLEKTTTANDNTATGAPPTYQTTTATPATTGTPETYQTTTDNTNPGTTKTTTGRRATGSFDKGVADNYGKEQRETRRRSTADM